MPQTPSFESMTGRSFFPLTSTLVRAVRLGFPKSVSVQETVENCLFLMREFGFRHLPLTDGKELKGLVSLRDIPLQVLAEKEAEGRRIAV